MADRPAIVWLASDRPNGLDPSLLGGKAGALARLVERGEPVPRSAVVTTAAHVVFTALPQIAAIAQRLRDTDAEPEHPANRRPDGSTPPIAPPTDDEIDQAFLDAPLPRELEQPLAELAAGFTGPVAVRSSATSEDLAGAAFAGQYRTVLDVPPDDIERAIRLVWASLWHAAPRTYRRLRAIDERSPGMAVLVMEMIDADRAGVLFTRDPVGDAASLRVEVVDGCGEALVSGAVTPEAHRWPREQAALAAARLGAGARELVERGLELEAAWGTPLDIEFAIDRTGRLWLVQVRPVTAMLDQPGGTLTRAGIAEILPGVLPPLLQATAAAHVDEGFRNLLDGLGADLSSAVEARFVRIDRSRALLDLDLLRRATATVPGGSVSALDRGYDAAPSMATSTANVAPARNTAGQIVRVMRRRREAVLESGIVVQAVDRLVADDGGSPDDLDDLLARWERLQDLGARATTAEMAVAALATAAHEGVERTLGRYVDPPRARELAQRLTTRSGRSGQSERNVGPLARCLDASGVDPDRPLAGKRWADALARSGSRSVFGGPTWADDPELAALAHGAALPAAARGGHADGLLRSIRPEPGRPRLSRVRRRFVRREAADATELLDRRERTKQALLDLGGIAHRLTVVLGERLVELGALSAPEDVWLLTPTELRGASRTGATPNDLEERRTTFDADQAVTTVATTAAAGSGCGWPASPGTASGPAVVVDVPRAGALRPGDVLVARSTDAAWAPLFAIAAAIVVEEGGPLSHASIVARELGVPAVVNLPGVVDRVRAAGPDAVLHVDGTTGEVLLDDAPPELSAVIGPPEDEPPELAPVIGPPEDEPRLGVFVTGLIGASALLGVVMSVTEAVSSERGIRRTQAHAAAPAAIVADVVRHGTGIVPRSTVGLAPASHYLRWAFAIAATAALLGAVTLTEYVADESGGRVVWLVTALSLVPAGLVGAHLAHRAATRWPDVPPLVRRVTPRPRPHPTLRQCWNEMPALHRRWLTLFASTAIGLVLLNVFAPTALQTIDEPLYEALGAPDTDPWAPDWFGMYFGRPQVAVPIALLVALFTVRCRVLAVAYPITIMFGGLLNLGLGALVGKARPPFGAHADQFDSFPSGHAIEVTLLLGLAPLALAVLLRSRWAGRLARVVASGILAVMLIDGLREGSHWPTDHLGGFAIAMTAVVLVHALAQMPSLHRSCNRCPALALFDGRHEGEDDRP